MHHLSLSADTPQPSPWDIKPYRLADPPHIRHGAQISLPPASGRDMDFLHLFFSPFFPPKILMDALNKFGVRTEKTGGGGADLGGRLMGESASSI